MDRAYYIAKELLMTERTYKKDLEVITVVSRSSRYYNGNHKGLNKKTVISREVGRGT